MTEYAGERDGSERRFCLVSSRFNRMVTERLAEGARETLVRHGTDPDAVDIVQVPGAWELPWAARRAAESGRYDAIVAVGCVVRGETPHFEYICRGAFDGLSRLAAEGRVPVGLGLLSCDTLEQALARSGGEAGHKGEEAALSALELSDLSRSLP